MPFIFRTILTAALLASWFAPLAQAGEPNKDLLYVVDCSKSMNRIVDGKRMIVWAQEALRAAAAELPKDTHAGLRAFAHRIDSENEIQSCQDSELLVPIGPDSGDLLAAAIQNLEPRGRTPLSYTLRQLQGDFVKTASKTHEIILLSDGGESCGEDPKKALRALLLKGYRLRVFTLGFRIPRQERKELEALSRDFGGRFLMAEDGRAFQEQLVSLTRERTTQKNTEEEQKGKHGQAPSQEASGGAQRKEGGKTWSRAPVLEVDRRYRVARKDQEGKVYYQIRLPAAKKVKISAFPLPDCARGEDNENCPAGAVTLELVNDQGSVLTAVQSAALRAVTESPAVQIQGGSGGSYMLIDEPPPDGPRRDYDVVVTADAIDSGGQAPSGREKRIEAPISATLFPNKGESEIFRFNSLFSSLANEKSEKFEETSLLALVILTIIIIVVIETFFSKKRSHTHLLTRILGWYEVSASFYSGIVICVKTGLGLSNKIDASLLQIFFYLIFLIISGLGVRAGVFLIQGKNYGQSFWWGLFQVPFLSLTFAGGIARYICYFLMVAPAYLFVQIQKYLYRGGGIGFHLGAELQSPFRSFKEADAAGAWLGGGFQLVLGVNLIALAFLGLLFLARKIRRQDHLKRS